jgi:hypothetical protein
MIIFNNTNPDSAALRLGLYSVACFAGSARARLLARSGIVSSGELVHHWRAFGQQAKVGILSPDGSV